MADSVIMIHSSSTAQREQTAGESEEGILTTSSIELQRESDERVDQYESRNGQH